MGLLLVGGACAAASFDCSKARRPIEKFICAHPELDAADAHMGKVYRKVQASFPLKGFVLASQRVFVADYATCMLDDQGRTSTGSKSLQRCLSMVRDRIEQLEDQALARVYSNAADPLIHDGLTILVYGGPGRERIRLWGNWMPDAHKHQPFPDGKLCDLDAPLKPVQGGFKTAETDDALIRITEAQVSIDQYIMCTPRNGIASGSYRRIRP